MYSGEGMQEMQTCFCSWHGEAGIKMRQHPRFTGDFPVRTRVGIATLRNIVSLRPSSIVD
jgi:hypothetical protein